MPALKSSAVEHVDHDGEALIVTFAGGREYRYPTAGGSASPTTSKTDGNRF